MSGQCLRLASETFATYLIKRSNSIKEPTAQNTNKSFIVTCHIATRRPFGMIDVFTNVMKPGPTLASMETFLIFSHM